MGVEAKGVCVAGEVGGGNGGSGGGYYPLDKAEKEVISSSGGWGSGVARVMVVVRGVTVVVGMVAANVARMVCSNSDQS